MWQSFREIHITGDVCPDERPLLLLPNHTSWWDGFFALHLNQVLLRKRFHLMMLESQLSKHMFFSRAGAFSINQRSRDVINSLGYASELLSVGENVVVMFPQGQLGSQHQWQITFRRGVERVIPSGGRVQIILAAFLIDYYSHRLPTLTIALKEYNGDIVASSIERAFNEHLQASIMNQDRLFEV